MGLGMETYRASLRALLIQKDVKPVPSFPTIRSSLRALLIQKDVKHRRTANS